MMTEQECASWLRHMADLVEQGKLTEINTFCISMDPGTEAAWMSNEPPFSGVVQTGSTTFTFKSEFTFTKEK